MHAVAERLRERHHRQHRQPHPQRQVPAGQQDRPAALGFDEAQTAAVVGPGKLRVVDAAAAHHGRVGGGGHVTESDDALQRQVIQAAGHHQLSLAQPDLVDTFLDRHRGGGARGYRVDHRTVATDVGLNHVRGNDIRQDFLEDVVRLVAAQQIAVVHRLHRRAAAHAGALGVGHQTRVHVTHHLGRAETGRQERVDGRHHVPYRQPVDGTGHVCADAPHRRVEPGRDLAADDAGQLGLSRHPDLGAGLADDLPVGGVGHRPDDRVLGIELDEGARIGLRGHHEREVLLQEHRHQQRRGVVGVDRAVINEFANADALHHGVVVALHQLGFVDHFAGFGVVPTGLRVVLPADQPSGPGQLQHAGRRQLVFDLHLEPGA